MTLLFLTLSITIMFIYKFYICFFIYHNFQNCIILIEQKSFRNLFHQTNIVDKHELFEINFNNNRFINNKMCNVTYVRDEIYVNDFTIRNMVFFNLKSVCFYDIKYLILFLLQIFLGKIKQYLPINFLYQEKIIEFLDDDLLSRHVLIQESEFWHKKTIIIQNDGNFISNLRAAGLTDNDISIIYQALQWQLDLCSLRKGDQFSILISRKRFDKKKNYGTLLGMKLHAGDKDYYAFRTKDGNFCNLKAMCPSEGFMRFPIVKKFRISSTFNMHRLNPVTGRISPHCGVDFAVPIGTPVFAVGGGEVIISKYGGLITGNYIAIRHNCKCITRYMHLKKILVKRGQKVKMGDNIALSGNTGRTTGPHLHFEIWVNKRAVNPLTIKLLHINSLSGSDRSAYMSYIQNILPQL
ncbi:murein DD-endopeptidase MepM [Blochmannia endosymbiont of Colobopsis nipponica]|nr:murein DD-endopeptidase MepM [Blochmannia endosymbiont of Colobopsis nipponica]